jgi:hypothetical protein
MCDSEAQLLCTRERRHVLAENPSLLIKCVHEVSRLMLHKQRAQATSPRPDPMVSDWSSCAWPKLLYYNYSPTCPLQLLTLLLLQPALFGLPSVTLRKFVLSFLHHGGEDCSDRGDAVSHPHENRGQDA